MQGEFYLEVQHLPRIEDCLMVLDQEGVALGSRYLHLLVDEGTVIDTMGVPSSGTLGRSA